MEADVLTWPNAVLSIGLFLAGIAITRVFKKSDASDAELDSLKECHAALDEKHEALRERVTRVEHTHKTVSDTIIANHTMTRESIHKAAERATETFAQRDEVFEIKRMLGDLPEKMEARFRGILADRDAHKK